MTKRLSLAVVLALILPKVTLAHGGGLDGSGCHHDRRTGDYHCRVIRFSWPKRCSFGLRLPLAPCISFIFTHISYC